MNAGIKRIVVTLVSICTVLTLLATGCSNLPPAQPSVPIPESPTTEPQELVPELKQLKPSTSAPPRAPAAPVDGKLHISEAPRAGETAELTFTFRGYLPLKTRVEFERYDPTLYYPLGKGPDKDDKLQLLAENKDSKDPYLVYLMEAAEEQPETSVPQEAVIVSGDFNWEGVPPKGGEVEITATVCFPEEGEWLVKGSLEREEGIAHTYDVMYLTIGEDFGEFGWPKDYSKGGIWTPPSEKHPISVTIKPSQAPLLGEPFELNMTVKSIRDLAQAEATLEVFRMEGTTKVTVPLEDILVEGDLAWQGKLEEDIPVELSGTVVFPEEGDWGIHERSRSSPESGGWSRHSIFLHVGKDKSRFGWTETHERKLGDEDIKPTPTPIPGKESERDNLKSSGKGQITVSGTCQYWDVGYPP